MPGFNEFFKDEYQFSLKDISYTKVETEEEQECELEITDTISADINGDSLIVTFVRNVCFKPEAIFDLKVAFDIILFINEEKLEEAKRIDWSKTLIENPNMYLGNVVSRISQLIAVITASYGQQPLITPPKPITEEAII